MQVVSIFANRTVQYKFLLVDIWEYPDLEYLWLHWSKIMLLLESEMRSSNMFCPSQVHISQGFLKLKPYLFYSTILLFQVWMCDSKDLSFDNYSFTKNKICFCWEVLESCPLYAQYTLTNALSNKFTSFFSDICSVRALVTTEVIPN